jgi:hypothetical protein
MIGGPYNRQTIKVAHLLVPLLCLTTGYLLDGYPGSAIAGLTLAFTHATAYNDRAQWSGG